MEIVLTKSDFLDYRHCAKSLWLKKRKPDAIQWPAPSLFDRMLMQDGYRVEEEVKKLVTGWGDGSSCEFQVDFQCPPNLYARADMVRHVGDDEIDLFEIKGSTSLRSSTGQDHVDDAAFQTMVAERAGLRVRRICVIHVNKEYVRQGAVDPEQLLAIVDVTEDARGRLPQIEAEVDDAIEFLAQDAIDENGCSCRLIGSRDKHCASFQYFNADVPESSIYLLPRISRKKLETFLEEGRLSLADIDASEVTNLQAAVLRAAQSGSPVINRASIATFLGELEWPIYFYDYETFASAIPVADGLRPQGQMPVQYSLHRLTQEMELSHTEYLSLGPGMQRQLVEGLRRDIGDTGSLVSWNKKFEMACNSAIGEMFPDLAEFLEELNRRTVDLMDVFKEDYVDATFLGSTSIKKVLPVLCPDLKYDEDAVHDGAGAMAAWLSLIETADEAERERIAGELRAYCHLDTLAMVEIYRFLSRIAQG